MILAFKRGSINICTVFGPAKIVHINQ